MNLKKNKKILLYIDTMERGGAQRVLLNLMEHYVSRDADVVLVNDFWLDSNASQYKL